MSSLVGFLARHCRMLAILAVLSAAIPACWLPRLQIDNSIEVWLARDSDEFKRYQAFLKKYGADEFVVIAVDVIDPFAPQTLQQQRELAKQISAVSGVDRVWDLPGLARAFWADKEGWQDEARKSAFLRNVVLGPDGKTAGMFVWFKELHGPIARRDVIENIEAAIAAVSRPGFTAHMAGAPRMNVALDRASGHDSAIFLPIAISICFLALAIMLRSFAGVIAPLCAVGVSAAWTVGLMVMTGHTLNVVTIVMPTLHFVLGLSNGIRLASRYDANLPRMGDSTGAVRETLRELLVPLLFMSLTMAVGFMSLLSSDLQPIVELGLFSAIGLIIAFLSNILIVPGILTLLSSPMHRMNARTTHWSSPVVVAVARRPWSTVGVAGLVLIACASTLPRLQTESNVLKFFPDESEIVRDYAFIGQRLTGFYTVELDVRCPEELAYDTLDGIRRLDKAISALPAVVRVDHIGKTDQLPKVAKSSGAEDSPLSGLAERFYYEKDGEVSYRVCVLVNAMGSTEFYPLLDAIRAQARQSLPKGAKWDLTGVVSLLNDAQAALVATQVKSFASAFGIIILMIALLFRSLRAALASVLPNLVPIMLTFAWMSVRHILLDAATVMIASVAIGIAVDNTIYFLARYREEKSTTTDSLVAVRETLNSIGAPITYTSLVAAAGFGILAFAQFQPVVYFGVLTAITMLTALAGTLLLTPASVRAFGVWEEP